MSELTLDELANKYQTDKGTRYLGDSRHGYAPIYESYLSKWRDYPVRMLEIGVCMEFTTGGHSIKMWGEYFPKAHIYTFDIVDMSGHETIRDSDRVKFYRGDQGKREDLEAMYTAFGSAPFDFILEDGSHQHPHQVITLGTMFKYVMSGGYYILEDMSIPGHPVCCIRNDATYQMIENFKNTGKMITTHTEEWCRLTEEEKIYLEDNIESIDVHHDIQDAYAVAIIKKK